MHKGSFLEFDFDKKFDFCVSNPPFYHSNVIKSENENIKIARYIDDDVESYRSDSCTKYDFYPDQDQILI